MRKDKHVLGFSGASGSNVEACNSIWVHDFTATASETICKSLLEANSKDPVAPIIMYIDSYGGAVDALAGIISVMESIPNPIVTVVTGTAMSCGAILLSYGEYRYVGANSRVMIHEVSSSASGNINDQKNSVAETDRVNIYWMNKLAGNCGKKNYSALKKYMTSEHRDVYLSAEASIRFGIADHIGIPKLSQRRMYHLDNG